MITVAFDTTTPVLAIAATRADEVLFEYHKHIGREHGELLLPTLAELLTAHGVTPRDISRVVTGVGPGSYTGVKIGLAAAQGIARGSGAVVQGFTSLACLVPKTVTADPLTVLVSAGRGRFYAQTFSKTAAGLTVLDDPWRIANAEPRPSGNVHEWQESEAVYSRNLLALRGVEPTLQPYYL